MLQRCYHPAEEVVPPQGRKRWKGARATNQGPNNRVAHSSPDDPLAPIVSTELQFARCGWLGRSSPAPCSAVEAPPHPAVQTTMRSLSGGGPRYVFLLLALLPFRVGAAAPDANRICVPRSASPRKRVKSNIRRENLESNGGLKRNLAEETIPNRNRTFGFASVTSSFNVAESLLRHAIYAR